MAHFSKGFPASQTASPPGSHGRPALGAAFSTAIAASLRALRSPSAAARARAAALLHCGVDALGEGVLPLLPAALNDLLSYAAGARDVADLLALLTQLAPRFRHRLAPLLAPALPALHARAAAAAAPAASQPASSEEVRRVTISHTVIMSCWC